MVPPRRPWALLNWLFWASLLLCPFVRFLVSMVSSGSSLTLASFVLVLFVGKWGARACGMRGRHAARCPRRGRALAPMGTRLLGAGLSLERAAQPAGDRAHSSRTAGTQRDRTWCPGPPATQSRPGLGQGTCRPQWSCQQLGRLVDARFPPQTFLTLTPVYEVGRPGSPRLLLALRMGDAVLPESEGDQGLIFMSLSSSQGLLGQWRVPAAVSPMTHACHSCTEGLVLGLLSASSQLAPGCGLPVRPDPGTCGPRTGCWTRASQSDPSDRSDQSRRRTPVTSSLPTCPLLHAYHIISRPLLGHVRCRHIR